MSKTAGKAYRRLILRLSSLGCGVSDFGFSCYDFVLLGCADSPP